jgi:hypothetical protein
VLASGALSDMGGILHEASFQRPILAAWNMLRWTKSDYNQQYLIARQSKASYLAEPARAGPE